MITKIVLHNFKRFKDATFELHPHDITLFVGGNNSGKSTILEALSIWEYCKNILIYVKGVHSVCRSGRCDGYGVTLDEFTPVNMPSFRYLWTRLKFQGSYTLSIDCHWVLSEGTSKHLKIGLSLTQERLFVKKMESDVDSAEQLPHIAYLPTFAGISSKEQRYSTTMRNSLIGQGLAGSVLRNQLLDLHRRYWDHYKVKRGAKKRISDKDLQWLREHEPFSLLNRIIYEVFKGQIQIEPFNENFHASIHVNFVRGQYIKNRFVPDRGTVKHDIMVEGRGFLQWLSVYTFAVSPDLDVLLLDEPDAHLHPSLQSEMLRKLCDIQQKTNNQILLATHSSEVIKTFTANKIFSLQKTNSGRFLGYLSDDGDKVRVLSGIGTEYFPLMDAIQTKRKILFVENQSDADTLKRFCEKYDTWPSDIVIWPYACKHTERKHIFLLLLDQIHDPLNAISLSDRDNAEYAKITPSLFDRSMKQDLVQGSSKLRYRAWRRWEIESYLIIPSAISRLIHKTNTTRTLEECRADLDLFMSDELAIVVHDDVLMQSNRVPRNAPVFDMDAKAILDPICNHFHINKYDILDEVYPTEICDDIKTMIAEIKSL